jgi:S-disulfanyl-L-cysteine oxidoreductase SoxD
MRRALIAYSMVLALAAGLLSTLASSEPLSSGEARRAGAGGAQGAGQPAAPLGIGRAATPEDIRKIDIDAMPDGRGLPPGKGTVAEGAAVYAAKCQSCHGPNGQGGKFDRLVGLEAGVKTIGTYWPYATTLYDYTARSMPFLQPGTLTPTEVYGVVAYLLHLNEIVPESAVMDAATLPKVQMPARDKFVRDDRTGGKVVK